MKRKNEKSSLQNSLNMVDEQESVVYVLLWDGRVWVSSEIFELVRQDAERLHKSFPYADIKIKRELYLEQYYSF